MRVLITGANGQVGWELQKYSPQYAELVALTSSQLDITDRNKVKEAFLYYKPDLVINAAAYTAVDKAETERDKAFAVNADGPGYIAEMCANFNSRLVHISTDFVFDGQQSTPYKPIDTPNPICVYGSSKLGGEQLVKQYLCDEALVIRTAWVYSSHGNNFLKTMLRVMREREQIDVVSDQVGTPTNAVGIAKLIWSCSAKDVKGTYHWTDAGVASWYDFAVAIMEEALSVGILNREIAVQPISTAEFPTVARRPSYSVLDKGSLWESIDVTPEHWRCSLRKILASMA